MKEAGSVRGKESQGKGGSVPVSCGASLVVCISVAIPKSTTALLKNRIEQNRANRSESK
jgi:hypothetical protein